MPHGSVSWGLGILLGAASTLGGYLGSRTATSRGSGFIRVAFLVVVTALVARVGRDVWTENLRTALGWPGATERVRPGQPSPDPVMPRLPGRRPGTDPGPGVVHEETE